MRYEAFYHSARWIKKRERILRRDGYQCQYAKQYGRLEEANTVHHIFPRRLYPQYAWEDWNPISVSAANHNKLENRATGELTEEGRAMMEAKAKERGIKLRMTVLVIGLPGTGKTTYAKQHLGADGLCYDLDHLAAAFRLTEPKAERHGAARHMANDLLLGGVFAEGVDLPDDLLLGFAQNADLYSPVVYIIRTAPTLTEIDALEPDEVVVLSQIREDRKLPKESMDEMRERIDEAIAYLKAKIVPVTEA